MSPPHRIFSVNDLPEAIQTAPKDFKLKRRKGGDFDLEKCELLEMVQYSCDPPEVRIRKLATDPMICEPIVRLFRRCAKGSKMFLVETTAWEGDLATVDAQGLTPSEAYAKAQQAKAKLKSEASARK